VCEAGSEYRLRTATTHVAVAYLDRILSASPMDKSSVTLLVAACLLIACKFEESYTNTPSAARLIDFGHIKCSVRDVLSMEVTVLTALDFRARVVTPVHLIDYLLVTVDVAETTFSVTKTAHPEPERMAKQVAKFVNFFANLSLLDSGLQQQSPILLSCAVIACARAALELEPMWTPSLELATVTGLSEFAELQTCLYKQYTEAFPSHVRLGCRPGRAQRLTLITGARAAGRPRARGPGRVPHLRVRRIFLRHPKAKVSVVRACVRVFVCQFHRLLRLVLLLGAQSPTATLHARYNKKSTFTLRRLNAGLHAGSDAPAAGAAALTSSSSRAPSSSSCSWHRPR
jgi:hypothetical protein